MNNWEESHMKGKIVLKRTAALAMAVLVGTSMTTANVLAAETQTEKEETVYVNAGADGSVEKVTVSEWLKNDGSASEIKDESTLKNIENVKGDETFSQDSDGSITWDAQGNDIYYQGESDQELPVSMKITYYLDGQEISPTQLAGKSGKVQMRFDYYNHSVEEVELNGEIQEIYTPFMMTTGVILPTDKFTNVAVENGKVISDGNNNMVVGIAFPGLNESLHLSDMETLEDKNIPDYVLISADVEDFSLALTATVATTGILSEFGLDDIGNLDDLTESLDLLSESSTSLVNGSGELLDGVAALGTACETLVEGLSSEDSGAGELKVGIDTLNGKKDDLIAGVKALEQGISQLDAGAKELASGVGEYTSGVDVLAGGMDSVDTGAAGLKDGLHTLNEESAKLKAGTQDLYAGANDLNSGLSTLKAGVNNYTANTDALVSGITALYSGSLAAMDFSALPESAGKISSAAQGIAGGANGIVANAGDLKTTVQGVADQITGANTTITNAKSTIDSASSFIKNYAASFASTLNSAATDQAKNQVSAALAGIDDLSDAEKNAILSSINVDITSSINTSTTSLSSASASLNEDSSQLATVDVSDIKNVSDSLTELANNAQSLNASASELDAGVQSLGNLPTQVGTMSGALKELSEKGQELVGYNETLNQGVSDALDGSQALLDGTKNLDDGVLKAQEGIGKLEDGAGQLKDGTEKLKNGAMLLTANNDTLNTGASQVKAGSDALLTGSQTLSSATGALSSGVQALADGAQTLKNGTAQLLVGGAQFRTGISTLNDGAQALNDGMTQFDEEGIQKLTSMFEGDLQSLLDRVKTVADKDKEGYSYGGCRVDMKNSAKFIFETGPIE